MPLTRIETPLRFHRFDNGPTVSAAFVMGELGAMMIVRVLKGRVRLGDARQLHLLLREQLVLMTSYDGLVYVKLVRRVDGDVEEVLLFEEWRDAAAMYAWAGTDLARARLTPGAQGLLQDVWITHFEALDVEPAEAPPYIRVEPD